MPDGSEVFEGRLPRLVREQLAEVVRDNGAEILDDPRRVKAMLGDSFATARREINLINVALSEGVAERLAGAARDPLRLRTEIETLTGQLVRNNAFQPEAASWAVRSCAWALGLAPAPEDLEPAFTPPAPVGPDLIPDVPPPLERPPAPARPVEPPPVAPPPVVAPAPPPERLPPVQEPPAAPPPVTPPPVETNGADGPPRAPRRGPFLILLGVCALVIGGLVIAAVALNSSSSSSTADSATTSTTTPRASTTTTTLPPTVWVSSTPPDAIHQQILDQVPLMFAQAASCKPIALGDADPMDKYPQGPDQATIECVYPQHGAIVFSLFANDTQMQDFFAGRLSTRSMTHGQGAIGPTPPWELDYTGDALRGSGSIFGFQRPGNFERSEVGFIRTGTHIYAYSFALGTDYAAYYRWWASVFQGPAPPG